MARTARYFSAVLVRSFAQERAVSSLPATVTKAARRPFGVAVAGADDEPRTPLFAGGPLGTRPVEMAQAPLPVERVLCGLTREGLPEVRLVLPVLRGAELQLSSAPHGLLANFVFPSEAAHRAALPQIAELLAALRGRGLRVARVSVAVRKR